MNNNTFEGKIWVDWKGKDGKMGQEISWREKPNFSALRVRVRVRGILNVNGTGAVPACTRVQDYGRVRAVSQISGCGRPAANNTHISLWKWLHSVVCQHEFAFLRALFTCMSTENIGSDRTSADVQKKTSAIGSAGKTDIGWSLVLSGIGIYMTSLLFMNICDFIVLCCQRAVVCGNQIIWILVLKMDTFLIQEANEDYLIRWCLLRQ